MRWSIAVSQPGTRCSLPEVNTCAVIAFRRWVWNGNCGDRRDKSDGESIGAREKDNWGTLKGQLREMQRVLEIPIFGRSGNDHGVSLSRLPLLSLAKIIFRERHVKPHKEQSLLHAYHASAHVGMFRTDNFWRAINTRDRTQIFRGGLWTVMRK